MLKLATAAPPGVYRTSASRPRLPTRITLFTLPMARRYLSWLFVGVRDAIRDGTTKASASSASSVDERIWRKDGGSFERSSRTFARVNSSGRRESRRDYFVRAGRRKGRVGPSPNDTRRTIRNDRATCACRNLLRLLRT